MRWNNNKPKQSKAEMTMQIIIGGIIAVLLIVFTQGGLWIRIQKRLESKHDNGYMTFSFNFLKIMVMLLVCVRYVGQQTLVLHQVFTTIL